MSMFLMYLFESLYFGFKSNPTELGKDLCNADKIWGVLPVKCLISNDKFDLKHSFKLTILVVSPSQLFEMYKQAPLINSVWAREGSLWKLWIYVAFLVQWDYAPKIRILL